MTPPLLASWLAAALLSDADRDAVLGDLAEELDLRARAGASIASARRWYIAQVLRSTPLFVWSALEHRRWVSTAAAAAIAYLAASVAELVVTSALHRVLTLDPGAAIVLDAFAGLSTMMLGAYGAARLRPRAAGLFAAIVFAVVAALMIALPASVPLWYQLAFLSLGPAVSLSGGSLAARGILRRGDA